jgi:hypothetical protein
MQKPARTFSAALMAALVIASPAFAGQLDDALSWENGDHAAALRYFRPLADRGSTIAQFDLGVMYKFGVGVPQDYVIAHMWFNLAAAGETKVLGIALSAARERDELSSKMSPAQVAEAQKLAREWKPSAGR